MDQLALSDLRITQRSPRFNPCDALTALGYGINQPELAACVLTVLAKLRAMMKVREAIGRPLTPLCCCMTRCCIIMAVTRTAFCFCFEAA